MTISETKEQEALIQRAQYHPITRDLLYAIPNDGKRSVMTGAAFKRRGLRPGMPDICLPYPSKGFHALYIELKTKTGKPTQAQLDCMARLNRAGNYAVIAYGWEQAWEIISDYLNTKPMNIKVEHNMQITRMNYTENIHSWNITMQGYDWPWMMKSTKVFCPDCKSLDIKKNGLNYKGIQQYRCLNATCNRHSFVHKFKN
jgi:hypothetical protein